MRKLLFLACFFWTISVQSQNNPYHKWVFKDTVIDDRLTTIVQEYNYTYDADTTTSIVTQVPELIDSDTISPLQEDKSGKVHRKGGNLVSSGVSEILQKDMLSSDYVAILPKFGSTELTSIGVNSPTTVGGVDVQTFDATEFLQHPNVVYSTSGDACGWYSEQATCIRGGSGLGSEIGGFNATFRFGFNVADLTGEDNLLFAGYLGQHDPAIPANLTLLDSEYSVLGIGFDIAGDHFYLYHQNYRDGLIAEELDDMPFPSTARDNLYELKLQSIPGSDQIIYQLEDLITQDIDGGIIDSDLPPIDTEHGALFPTIFCRSSGTLALSFFGFTQTKY